MNISLNCPHFLYCWMGGRDCWWVEEIDGVDYSLWHIEIKFIEVHGVCNFRRRRIFESLIFRKDIEEEGIYCNLFQIFDPFSVKFVISLNKWANLLTRRLKYVYSKKKKNSTVLKWYLKFNFSPWDGLALGRKRGWKRDNRREFFGWFPEFCISFA